jgi:hypothetical protein
MITKENISQSDMWSLGHFQPTSYRRLRSELFKHFSQYVEISDFEGCDHGIRRAFPIQPSYIDYRSHHFNVLGLYSSITTWHKDLSNGPSCDNVYLMVWSNSISTEFKKKSFATIYGAEPNEVIVFRNGSWLHRTPSMTDKEKKNRHFARLWFQIKK